MQGLSALKSVLGAFYGQYRWVVRCAFASLLLLTSVGYSKTLEQCFHDSSEKNGVPVHLLFAVAFTESSFRPHSLNKNKNGSHDYGLMQINSIWSKEAKKHGFSWEKIKKDPCANVMFGGYILKQNKKRLGSWSSAIGAYNAGFSKSPKARKVRQRYYQKVMRNRLIAQRHIKRLKRKARLI